MADITLSDIWGAKEPEPEKPDDAYNKNPFDWLEGVPNNLIRECVLNIHQRAVEIHDQYPGGVTSEQLRSSVGMVKRAWLAVMNLTLEYFDDRPMNIRRLFKVSSRIDTISNQEWYLTAKSGLKLDGVDPDETI